MERRHRRRFSRFCCEGRVRLAARGKARSARLIDLSLKGVLLERPADWQVAVGAQLDVDIHLELSPEPVHMSAVVARIEGRTMGVKCRRIDPDSIAVLRDVVERSLGDQGLLDRELAEIGC